MPNEQFVHRAVRHLSRSYKTFMQRYTRNRGADKVEAGDFLAALAEHLIISFQALQLDDEYRKHYASAILESIATRLLGDNTTADNGNTQHD